MTQRSTDLHFNRVALFQRSVQDAWCVNDLPPEVAVVHVSHKERLRGECVRLHVHVCARDLCSDTMTLTLHTCQLARAPSGEISAV